MAINKWTDLTLSIPINSYVPTNGKFILIALSGNPVINNDPGLLFGQMISTSSGTYNFKVFFGYILSVPGPTTSPFTGSPPPIYVGYNIIDFMLEIEQQQRKQFNTVVDFIKFKKHKHAKKCKCKDKHKAKHETNNKKLDVKLDVKLDAIHDNKNKAKHKTNNAKLVTKLNVDNVEKDKQTKIYYNAIKHFQQNGLL
jgi:hypothetical protein